MGDQNGNGNAIIPKSTNYDTIGEIIKAEIDIQISTAKAYPRNITEFKEEALSMATLDPETAEACLYRLPRAGKTIEGPSVRLAEIVYTAWGNCRAAARVISNDGKTITAQGIFHDLERNSAVTVEVKRKITDKYGKTYTEDMQVVTGNAACAIALRNAIFKGIPMAYTKDVYRQVKDTILGNVKDIASRRKTALDHFKAMGIKEDRIFTTLGVKGIDDIGLEEILTLIGMANAIRDGDSTPEEAFPVLQKKTESEVKANKALNDITKEIEDKKGKKSAEPRQAELGEK